MSYSTGNLSSGTGALTTIMSNATLSSGSIATHLLNAHSAPIYTQDSSLPSSSSVSRTASSLNGADASHVAPGSHPHSGFNSGKSVEQSPRGSRESNSSLTTNPSLHGSESMFEGTGNFAYAMNGAITFGIARQWF